METEKLVEESLHRGERGLLESELRRRGIDLSLPELEAVFIRELLRRAPVAATTVKGGFTDEEEQFLEAGGLPADRGEEGTTISSRQVAVGAAAEYAALLASSLSVAQAARVSGLSEGRVRQRLAARTLYGLKEPGADPVRAKWLLPRFQFAGDASGNPTRLLPGIGVVAREIDRALPPIVVARWFISPNDELIPQDAGGAGEEPLSPRDWLLAGLPPERVALLARYLGEIL